MGERNGWWALVGLLALAVLVTVAASYVARPAQAPISCRGHEQVCALDDAPNR